MSVMDKFLNAMKLNDEEDDGYYDDDFYDDDPEPLRKPSPMKDSSSMEELSFMGLGFLKGSGSSS